jgi:hypothetical protein
MLQHLCKPIRRVIRLQETKSATLEHLPTSTKTNELTSTRRTARPPAIVPCVDPVIVVSTIQLLCNWVCRCSFGFFTVRAKPHSEISLAYSCPLLERIALSQELVASWRPTMARRGLLGSDER